MTIEVEIAGTGQIIEFPDGTDPATIERALLSLGSQAGTVSLGEPTPQPVGASVFEPIATMVSGAVAEPIAGLAGIAQAVNPLADPGAGVQAIEDVRQAMTLQPRTKAGQRSLQNVATVVEPIAKKFEQAEDFLGDETFKLTNSPTLAAAAKTFPTFVTELLGVSIGGKTAKTAQKIKRANRQGKIAREITDAAPSIEQLKGFASDIYKEIDSLGVTMTPRAYKGLVNKIVKDVQKSGLDPDITPKAFKTIKRFQELEGQPVTLEQIDTLRKVAGNAATSLEKADSALGVRIQNNIDSFLDNVGETALRAPDGSPAKNLGISKKYRTARDLWGRARRSELIQESFEKARNQASGFENGLRIQFRALLNNKKTRKFFNKREIEAMNKVVRGDKKENLARLIGGFAFSEGSARNLLMGTAGASVGGALGGAPGAVAVPIIGHVSRKLAQRMTDKNADFADQVIRAGKDAKKITRAYLNNTPKPQRSAQELSELLMSKDIDLSVLPELDLAQDAANIAQTRRAQLAGALAVQPSKEDEQ